MRSGPGDAHRRLVKTYDARLNRCIAEERRCFLLICGNDLSAVRSQQVLRKGRFAAVQSRLEQLPVCVICGFDKSYFVYVY
jgi:hypothetical protein